MLTQKEIETELVKRAKELRPINRKLQQEYRERHGEELRKTRRVATALMTRRRTTTAYFSSEGWVSRTTTALAEFLTAEERDELIKELTRHRGKRSRKGRK